MNIFPFGRKRQWLDAESQQRVVACIKEAEVKTSGEIRAFMEPHCSYVNAMDRAAEVFYSLGMEKTEGRNAILVYVAFEDRQFALFGDEEIYKKAGGPAFWEKAAERLSARLKQNEITEGLCDCINELAAPLALHFPHDASVNKNELPDEIVFGK